MRDVRFFLTRQFTTNYYCPLDHTLKPSITINNNILKLPRFKIPILQQTSPLQTQLHNGQFEIGGVPAN